MNSIEDKVCTLIQERKKLGLKKYGTSMERTDLSEKEWRQNKLEELLDAVIYEAKLQETSNPLSEDDMVDILALIKVSQKNLHGLSIKYDHIKKKLQDALNLV